MYPSVLFILRGTVFKSDTKLRYAKPIFGINSKLYSNAANTTNISVASPATVKSAPLSDLLGRRHDYLRISLTERCNLRCQYCMPAEGVPLTPRSKLLTRDELLRLVNVFAGLGVHKLRLTGGEPTLRSDLAEIIQELSSVQGIRTVSMTTNGLVLTRRLPALQRAGLAAINVSLDSLRAERYEKMARRPGLPKVLAGIDLALQLGYRPVKVNTVLMRGFNDDEICDFVEFTRDREVEVRFIEFMPFSGNRWDDSVMVPHDEALQAVRKRYPRLAPAKLRKCDTAMVWQVEGHLGSVGFISSMTRPFCSTCNRLRLTADGNLKVCLFGSSEVSLAAAIREGAVDSELRTLVRAALRNKKPQHAGYRNSFCYTGTVQASTWGEVLNFPPGVVDVLYRLGSGLVKNSSSSSLGLSVLRLRHGTLRAIERGLTFYRHAESRAHGESANDTDRGLAGGRPFDVERCGTFTARGPRAGVRAAKWGVASAGGASYRTPLPPTGGATPLAHLAFGGGASYLARPDARPLCTGPDGGAPALTHLDANGRARMVDVGGKATSERSAEAECFVRMSARLLRLLRDARLPKGDALTVAQVAGALAAKRTAELIPLCHSLPLEVARVRVRLPRGECAHGGAARVSCEVRATARTGVEMEALTGAALAALALYDMCKSVDRHMTVTDLRVVRKSGGAHDFDSTQTPTAAEPEAAPRLRAHDTSPLKSDETYVPTNLSHF
ncbi:unnamed protein product, partial [Iphiclides podalirius]